MKRAVSFDVSLVSTHQNSPTPRIRHTIKLIEKQLGIEYSAVGSAQSE